MSTTNMMLPEAAQLPNSNTDAVATYAAPTSPKRWVLYALAWSYSAAPAANSTIIISWTYNSVAYTFTFYVSAGGPQSMEFPVPLVFPPGTAVTVTLKAGGSGVSGSVYPIGRIE